MIFPAFMSDLFLAPFEWIDKVWHTMRRANWHTYQILTKRPGRAVAYCNEKQRGTWPDNIWLGVTIESPNHWKRAKILSQIPANVRFISAEPLLFELGDLDFRGINWYIVGCESGPGRRECKIEWVRNIVSQCKAANVPLFVKQLSINGKVEHDITKFPKDCQIQEYPK